jgi:hypothetical protein
MGKFKLTPQQEQELKELDELDQLDVQDAAKDKASRLRNTNLKRPLNEEQKYAMEGPSAMDRIKSTWAGVKEMFSAPDIAGVSASLADENRSSVLKQIPGAIGRTIKEDLVIPASPSEEDYYSTRVTMPGEYPSAYVGSPNPGGILKAIPHAFEASSEQFKPAYEEERASIDEAATKSPGGYLAGNLMTAAAPFAGKLGGPTPGGLMTRVKDTSRAMVGGRGGLIERAGRGVDAARGIISPGEGSPMSYLAQQVKIEGLPGQPVKPPQLPIDELIPQGPRPKSSNPQMPSQPVSQSTQVMDPMDLELMKLKAKMGDDTFVPSSPSRQLPASAPAFDMMDLDPPPSIMGRTPRRSMPMGPFAESESGRIDQVMKMADELDNDLAQTRTDYSRMTGTSPARPSSLKRGIPESPRPRSVMTRSNAPPIEEILNTPVDKIDFGALDWSAYDMMDQRDLLDLYNLQREGVPQAGIWNIESPRDKPMTDMWWDKKNNRNR